jgi:hypothetical protein
VTKKKVNGVFARSFKRPLQEELRTHCKKCAGFVESARDGEIANQNRNMESSVNAECKLTS